MCFGGVFFANLFADSCQIIFKMIEIAYFELFFLRSHNSPIYTLQTHQGRWYFDVGTSDCGDSHLELNVELFDDRERSMGPVKGAYDMKNPKAPTICVSLSHQYITVLVRSDFSHLRAAPRCVFVNCCCELHEFQHTICGGLYVGHIVESIFEHEKEAQNMRFQSFKKCFDMNSQKGLRFPPLTFTPFAGANAQNRRYHRESPSVQLGYHG